MDKTVTSEATPKAAKSQYNPIPQIAIDLALPQPQVAQVVSLLNEGNTVPFIARYRKEATGGLDEVQIRSIEERKTYLCELDDRRNVILESIEGQGKLTDELKAKIMACAQKTELEDLYLPYKPKRRTRAIIARERGLGPLGDLILAQPLDGDPEAEAQKYVDAAKEVPDIAAALKGAKDIVAEAIADQADVRALVRGAFKKDGALTSEATDEAKAQRTQYEQYYDYQEPVGRVPSHRYLAVRRGEREGMLRVGLSLAPEPLMPQIELCAGYKPRSPFAKLFEEAAADAYKRLIAPSVETDVRVDMKQVADEEAVEIFAKNLRELLLASPLGGKAVIGLDPGIRTGCKTVALDATGKFLEYQTLFISQGDAQLEQAKQHLLRMVKEHGAVAVAVGNGTNGREAERFARKTLKDAGLDQVIVVQVSESGASIYSASDIAREEFPDLDLTVRGAISIGRRLQDPLAELVKVDPKSIGVGQYQHDVHQALLQKKLEDVVESCVNLVGVDLNTASAPLLAQVAGIGSSLAKRIVKHREQNGAFHSREELKKVTGLGPKTFEQCAGFLRIPNASNPLDASAVHPERYALVEKMAKDIGVPLKDLVGSKEYSSRINLRHYVSDEVGEPTLKDILSELEKPGRDPRTQFEPPKFRDDVETIEDLKPGMILEGVVTNVAAFGAFVDIGVHQDGLVHISELADKYVTDPSSVVSPGQHLKVRVLDIDLERKRISLSARMEERKGEPRGTASQGAASRQGPNRPGQRKGGNAPKKDDGFKNNPFAALLKGK